MCVHSYKSTKVTREREKKETNAENNFLKKEFGDCRNSNNTGKKTIGIVLSTLLYVFPFCLLFHVRRCVSCMCGFFMHLNEEKYEKKTHTKIALSCISVRNFFSLLRSNASMKISHILASTVTFRAF